MSNYQKKHEKYSAVLKEEIMNKYRNGQGTINSLSKEYDVPLNTMRTWQRKIIKNIDVSIDKRAKYSGKRKKENLDYKERYEILKNTKPF
jgi:transposase-like protein